MKCMHHRIEQQFLSTLGNQTRMSQQVQLEDHYFDGNIFDLNRQKLEIFWPVSLDYQTTFIKSSGHEFMCLFVYMPNLTRLVDTLFDLTLTHYGGLQTLFCMAGWVARQQERLSLVTVCDQNPKSLVDGCRFCLFATHAIHHLQRVCPLCFTKSGVTQCAWVNLGKVASLHHSFPCYPYC